MRLWRGFCWMNKRGQSYHNLCKIHAYCIWMWHLTKKTPKQDNPSRKDEPTRINPPTTLFQTIRHTGERPAWDTVSTQCLFYKHGQQSIYRYPVRTRPTAAKFKLSSSKCLLATEFNSPSNRETGKHAPSTASQRLLTTSATRLALPPHRQCRKKE